MSKHATANTTGWVRNIEEWYLGGFANAISLADLIRIYDRNTGSLPAQKFLDAYIEGMTVRSTNG